MIKPEAEQFPFCVVWTILPCLTWLIPWIGHAGICDSKGTIYDFLGYHVNVGSMTFAKVVKYVKIQSPSVEAYDLGIAEANKKFSHECHNLCCNNCHHHVAEALNRMKFEGKENWNQLDVWWLCLTRSQYVSWCDILKVYLPCLLITGIIIAIVFLTK